jgi:hypothetical protein
MEIRHVARSHDRQEDEEVREAYPLSAGLRERILNPLISALELAVVWERYYHSRTTEGQKPNRESR